MARGAGVSGGGATITGGSGGLGAEVKEKSC